jgi:hypothetical protein
MFAGAQSAVAGDTPRGVASRARSKRQLACSGVPRAKPSCSHFWLCAANGFEELSPGKQRTAEAAAMAMTMVRRTGISGWAPTEQIAGTSVNCYSSQASLGAKPLTFDFTEVIPLPSFSLRLGFCDAGIDRNVHIAWAYSSRAASCIRKLRNKLPRQPSKFNADLIFVSGRGFY